MENSTALWQEECPQSLPGRWYPLGALAAAQGKKENPRRVQAARHKRQLSHCPSTKVEVRRERACSLALFLSAISSSRSSALLAIDNAIWHSESALALSTTNH